MLQHETVLVMGIANSESIAFSTAVRASAAGARLVLAAFPRDVDSV